MSLIPRRGVGRPRSLPYPYDLWLSSKGYMLGYARGENGRLLKELVSTRPADLTTTVVPNEWGLGAQNPLYERVETYGSLVLGMGLKKQVGSDDQRYYYALNADLSAGYWLQGPAVTTVTPSTVDATVGITRFFEVGGGLYALNGRYCHKRTSDADWDTSRQDFGASKSAADAIVVTSNAAGSTTYAYVAMGTAEPIYRFDGTTWTQHAEASKIYSRAWARVGRFLYRASTDSTVTKVDVDSDPFTVANWDSAWAHNVGDSTYPIQRMLSHPASGVLLILKRDGLFSLDELGDQIQYHSQLQFASASSNGEAVGVFGNHVYATYNDFTFRLDGEFNLEEIGPERLMSNDSEVRGTPTAFQGHGTLGLYSGWYNADNGSSYVCKLGAWLETANAPAQRVDAWHGSITAAFSSKKITCLHKSTIGAPANHSRLYIGFSDGTLAYFTLPCTPNPAACDEYTFSTADGEVYLPVWTSPFVVDSKALRAYTVRTPNASGTNYVQLSYRNDPNAAWTDFATDFDVAVREKANFVDSTTCIQLEQKILLKGSAATSSPQVAEVGLYWRLALDLTQIYTVTILCADALFRRDGAPIRGRSAVEMVAALETNAATTGGVTCVFPDEDNKQVGVVGFRKTQAWNDRLAKWQAAIQLELVDLHTITVFGTYERLEAYTYEELSGFTYEQLETI